MPFTVTIDLSKQFETSASPERVFELLADVPRSASHFPDVEKLEPLGGNTFRWITERIAIGDHTLQQTIYACVYRSDRAAMSVSWTPVEGEGNARVEGGWRIEPAGTGSNVQLHTKGTLDVDLPGFLQFLLSPLIELAFTQKIDRYISNLQAAFAKG
ncbi:SRPBCC family protein [Chlorobaculum thiosulfatiphilum]|uniref:SRPBCC family protein n=1 Tax=Chlorobaculum thiosulfatiphilum TaxID=115852 RepID=A0A5C4S6M3_CHLTI|nr:SRPBCC family protein [Chlorobaculum thiosulfatiphilum]TNJ38882.1 SRPBCC family protein [Chlorobaculum thiosulfatiphilum]